MKKLKLLFLLSYLTSALTPAQSSEFPPRLVGIVDLPETRCAIIETRRSPTATAKHSILHEHQRDGQIQVARIIPQTGNVELLLWSEWNADGTRTNHTLVLNLSNHLEHAGFVFEGAPLDAVLPLYQQFSQRTLLRPQLAQFSLAVKAAGNSQAEAARALDEALVAKGLRSIPDGEKFLMVVPD